MVSTNVVPTTAKRAHLHRGCRPRPQPRRTHPSATADCHPCYPQFGYKMSYGIRPHPLITMGGSPATAYNSTRPIWHLSPQPRECHFPTSHRGRGVCIGHWAASFATAEMPSFRQIRKKNRPQPRPRPLPRICHPSANVEKTKKIKNKEDIRI